MKQMKTLLLLAWACCAAAGALEKMSEEDDSPFGAPAWHPAPGQRVPYGMSNSQIKDTLTSYGVCYCVQVPARIQQIYGSIRWRATLQDSRHRL